MPTDQRTTSTGIPKMRGLPLPRRLSVRLALLLTLALLPLGIVSILQTRELRDEIKGRTSEALLGETLREAAPDIGTIQMVRGAAAALSVSDDVLGPPLGCSALMTRAAVEVPQATAIAFVRADGAIGCSTSNGLGDGANGVINDLSDNPNFMRTIAARAPTFATDHSGPVSNQSVFGVSYPVFDNSAAYRGYIDVSLTLPRAELGALDATESKNGLPGLPQAVFWTFDRDGNVMTSSSGPDRIAELLPRDLALIDFVGGEAQAFDAVSVGGVQRIYSVVPLLADDFYLMSSWRIRRGSGMLNPGIAPYLPPLVMWMVGLLVAGWASERLVNRHMRTLQQSIGRFSSGDRRQPKVDMTAAPYELQVVGDAFATMTDSITRGEAELEDTIHQKEVLLREVHHRVKNNLQLIASIMNMQMRRAQAPEIKQVLKGLQDRVMSLATIHRGLYQTTGLADIHADELLSDIVRQIIAMGSAPGRMFDLALEIDNVRMTPDQAVPLSLLLTEAVTNAMKYAGAPVGETPTIAVRLKSEEAGAACLSVVNSLPQLANPAPPTDDGLVDSTGLGTQLLQAFAFQIGGTLTQEMGADDYTVTVRFEVSNLAVGENRTTPPNGRP